MWRTRSRPTDPATRALRAGAALCVSALALAALPRSGRANTIGRGVVLSIESGEIYFDIPKRSGLSEGAPLRIAHPIEVRHPVSGARVRDELPVGTATVTIIGETMSMARLAGELARRVEVGDVVEVLIESDELDILDPREVERRELPLPEVDAETAAVLAVWSRTGGAALDARIAAWERYLETHPQSPYAVNVREDLEILYEEQRRTPSRVLLEQPRVAGVEHHPPSRFAPGRPMSLAFAAKRPEEILAAWVHFRRKGDDSYRRAELQSDGDGYLRATLPADAVVGPGVEYFVEVATTRGRAGTAVASSVSPIEVDVESPSAAEILREPDNRSRVSISTTYLDYATFDSRGDEHEDRFFLVESDFMFRIRGQVLHGIRVGMGAINGRGGYADEPRSEEAGFNFGYTEFEFRESPTRAYLARLIAGLGRDGLGFGVEGRLRLGAEEDSNLTFALSSLEEIGFLSEVRMQWAAIDDMPLGFAVGVTDQPNQGDLGVRMTADIGWRALPWFQPTVRVSYQGRSVRHSGVGAGLGLVFDW